MHYRLSATVGFLFLTLILAGSAVAQQQSTAHQSKGAPGFSIYLANSQPAANTNKIKYDGTTYYLEKEPIVRISDIKSLSLGHEPSSDKWAVLVMLGPSGGEKMKLLTTKHLGEIICLSAAGKVVNCATIEGGFDTRFQLGLYSKEKALQILKLIAGRNG